LAVGAGPTRLQDFIIGEAPSGARLRAELRNQSQRKRAEAPPEAEETRSGRRALKGDEAIVVKKILSCVARMNDRFGKGTVAAVLRGSRSKQILDNKLDRLSTYGLLDDMGPDAINLFIKALIEAECIEIRSGPYPIIRLTDFGRGVMQGKAEVALDLPG
jgi:superfamily II DNA helicase RecQ